jgi:transposase-like protein
VIAIGVRLDGQREVLGCDVGAAETYEFWVAFLRGLVRRGLHGVRLVISDAHEGLRRALAEILAGTSWQRSRVHVMRNLLQRVPKHAHLTGRERTDVKRRPHHVLPLCNPVRQAGGRTVTRLFCSM